MPRSRTVWFSCLCLFAGLSATITGCGDDPAPSSPPPAEDTTPPDAGPRPDTTPVDTGMIAVDTTPAEEPVEEPCLPTLEAAGSTTVSMYVNETTSLTVRLAECDDTPIADALITFGTTGTTEGSQLTATNVFTNANGQAAADLVAGATAATFQVIAATTDGPSVTFNVTVEDLPTGDLEVTIIYGGTRTFAGFDTHLLRNRTCDELDPYALLEGVRMPITTTDVTMKPLFEDVVVATNYLVAVQAKNEDGHVRAYGCTDGVVVAEDRLAGTTVTLSHLPVVYSGVYALDNHFDMADALPPSVSGPIRLFDEMTDDDDLYDEYDDDQYGLDPAAFLLDFVYRQFCCWEALPDDYGDYSWSACQDQDVKHPYGDLTDLYLYYFDRWDGAQPSSTGLCGVLYYGNEFVQEKVQALILENVPSVVLRIADMAGDLARAFTEMHITSELRVGELWVDKTGQFTHELRTMIVDIHDLDGDLHTYEFDLTEAGLTNLTYTAETTATQADQLLIPAHDFKLDFGRLLVYVWKEVLLPNLECDYGDDGVGPCERTRDLLATWLNCTAVGDWLYDQDPIGFTSADGYANFCVSALTFAEIYIEGRISASVDAETILTIQGTAEAGSVNARNEAETLANGLWTGSLVEDDDGDPETVDDTFEADFDGTFTGTRTMGGQE